MPTAPDRGNRPWSPQKSRHGLISGTQALGSEKHSQQLVTDELVDDTGIS